MSACETCTAWWAAVSLLLSLAGWLVHVRGNDMLDLGFDTALHCEAAACRHRALLAMLSYVPNAEVESGHRVLPCWNA